MFDRTSGYTWHILFEAFPGDLSDDAVLASYNDHADGGFTFDGTEYRQWGEDGSAGIEWDDVVPCPGPYPPPLQGPAPAGDSMVSDLEYCARRCARFVYDEAAELALREHSRTQFVLPVNRPGFAWCEFA